MGPQVNIEINTGILFGLNTISSILISHGWEVIMENSNALMSYLKAIFWCGFAFLRRCLVTVSQSKREMDIHLNIYLPRANARRFDSFPPHHLLLTLDIGVVKKLCFFLFSLFSVSTSVSPSSYYYNISDVKKDFL